MENPWIIHGQSIDIYGLSLDYRWTNYQILLVFLLFLGGGRHVIRLTPTPRMSNVMRENKKTVSNLNVHDSLLDIATKVFHGVSKQHTNGLAMSWPME